MPRGKKSHQESIAQALRLIACDDLDTLARIAAERIVKLEVDMERLVTRRSEKLDEQLAKISKGND